LPEGFRSNAVQAEGKTEKSMLRVKAEGAWRREGHGKAENTEVNT